MHTKSFLFHCEHSLIQKQRMHWHYLVCTFLVSRGVQEINISMPRFIKAETKILLHEVLKYKVHMWSSEDNTQHLKTEGCAGRSTTWKKKWMFWKIKSEMYKILRKIWHHIKHKKENYITTRQLLAESRPGNKTHSSMLGHKTWERDHL